MNNLTEYLAFNMEVTVTKPASKERQGKQRSTEEATWADALKAYRKSSARPYEP